MKHAQHHGAIVLGLLGLFLLRACLPAQASTPAQYDAALAQVQAALARQAEAVRHGGTLPVAQSPAAVASRALTPIQTLERPGQAAQPVDASVLVAALRTADGTRDSKEHVARLRSAYGQIDALRHELAGAAGTTAADPTPTEDAVRAVLSSGIYQSDPLPPPSPFDRFVNWLDRAIVRLLRALMPRRSATMPDISPAFIRATTIILAVGAFAVLVAVLVQWLRRRPARLQPLALDETEAALVEARDTDSLRALAEQKAQAGDHRLALRLIYLALLVALDSGGVLRFDRSKTNWEYLRALRTAGRGDVYDAMTPLTRDFDRIWYGFAPADAADYARALTQYDALQAAPQAVTPARTTAAA